MIVDLILVGIIIVSLAIILFIIFKKFPIISSINIAKIPKHKQRELKDSLLEERLKRKFIFFKERTSLKAKPYKDRLKKTLKKLHTKILELERQYQENVNKEKDPEEIKNKIDLLFDEAEELVKNEKYNEAEKKFIEIIGLDNLNKDAYKSLAEVYLQLKEYGHAKEIYKFTLKIDSSDNSIYSSLGRIASQEGNFEEAEKEYLQSISINNKIASNYIDLGDVYSAMGRKDKALNSYQEAVKLEPNNPKNLDKLIEISIELKNKQIAQETYQKLKEVNPENQKLRELERRISLLK